jgi:hypothetical protein
VATREALKRGRALYNSVDMLLFRIKWKTADRKDINRVVRAAILVGEQRERGRGKEGRG